MPNIVPKEALFRKVEPYLVPAIVVLVGAGAFGLGRLSAMGPKPQLRILYPDAKAAQPVQASANAAAVANAVPSQSGQSNTGQGAPAGAGAYVASKSGTKYYLATCSGANRIKDENKVYFASAAQAAAAGYGPAANCPGL